MATDIQIRPAEPDDAPEIASVHVRAWRETYKGIVDQPFLDAMDIEARTRRWREGLAKRAAGTFVAVEGGRVAGFASIGPARDPQRDGQAELYAIYLDPPRRGRGIGRLLFAEAARYAAKNGFAVLFVNVLEANLPAQAFYERMGGRRSADGHEITIGERRFAESRYEWADLRGYIG
jgi:GNAT superfamily N-acetyltransferase